MDLCPHFPCLNGVRRDYFTSETMKKKGHQPGLDLFILQHCEPLSLFLIKNIFALSFSFILCNN